MKPLIMIVLSLSLRANAATRYTIVDSLNVHLAAVQASFPDTMFHFFISREPQAVLMISCMLEDMNSPSGPWKLIVHVAEGSRTVYEDSRIKTNVILFDSFNRCNEPIERLRKASEQNPARITVDDQNRMALALPAPTKP